MAGKAVPLRKGWAYRLNILVRALTGSIGAYLIAALTAAMLARVLPMPRPDAVTIATLLAYLVAPAVTLWAFLARGPMRALGLCSGLALALYAAYRLAGPPA